MIHVTKRAKFFTFQYFFWDRFTEFSNNSPGVPASSAEFLRMLRQVDSQLFDSFAGHSGLIDDECEEKIARLQIASPAR